jgi:hypothetical protein
MVGLSIGQKEYMNFSTTESQAGIRSQTMEVAFMCFVVMAMENGAQSQTKACKHR